jgi:hypothetical protein
MSDPTVSESDRHWLLVLSSLDEMQARLYVAQRAIELGRGGASRLSRLTGMSRPTIAKGMRELRDSAPELASGRLRRRGAGRKKSSEEQPGLLDALTGLLEETTAGDPMSELRWTCKATRALAEELTQQGFCVRKDTVAKCIRELGYSLQANVKAKEARQHEDRDAQFRYINRKVRLFMGRGDPVISVDTKKKELVGPFRNPGRTYRKRGEPERVNVHDFPDMAEGKAIPYGAYDVGNDEAVVNVGVSHDTAEFAVESIRRWWDLLGSESNPDARNLLICADAGGSNGPRLRGWKFHLQELADEIQLPITVCHYPPGTSKWNRIEHRLFSFISIHWRGRPLTSYETVVGLIGATSTSSGLNVRAVLDRGSYEKGKKISDEQMNAVKLKRHQFHGDWNYTIRARPTPAAQM